MRSAWQRAWAEYNTGQSAIDYVRTAGTGADTLLINTGQTGRRGRVWWRVILDQYGAADVLIPIARVEYSYPGGPIKGHFTARFGPDRSEEHTSELPSLMRISYAVFCLTKKKNTRKAKTSSRRILSTQPLNPAITTSTNGDRPHGAT